MEGSSVGALSGLNNHVINGYVSIAVEGDGSSAIAFNKLKMEPLETEVWACLAIDGNAAGDTVELGTFPKGEDSFNLPIPAGTDISLHNTVVVQNRTTGTDLAMAYLP